jgi:hypothetical protein
VAEAQTGGPGANKLAKPLISYSLCSIVAEHHSMCCRGPLLGAGFYRHEQLRHPMGIIASRITGVISRWFDALHIDRNVIFVVHDWGSAHGFD